MFFLTVFLTTNFRLADLNTATPIPLLVTSMGITALLLLLVLPVLLCLLLFAGADTVANTCFFEPVFGGDAVLFQHLFWIFGHPEVYIIILPGFGLVSAMCAILARTGAYGYISMTLAMLCIAFLGACVWAHHMFAAGMSGDARAYFTVVTIMIALPTATKIFNWSCTAGIHVAPVSSTTTLSFVSSSVLGAAIISVLLFLVLFTLGGATGVVLGNGSLSTIIHDTYYVIAHFHYVLSLGASLGLVVGLVLFAMVFADSENAYMLGGWVRALLLLLAAVLLVFTDLHSCAVTRRITDQQMGAGVLTIQSSIGSVCFVITLVRLLISPSAIISILSVMSTCSQIVGKGSATSLLCGVLALAVTVPMFSASLGSSLLVFLVVLLSVAVGLLIVSGSEELISGLVSETLLVPVLVVLVIATEILIFACFFGACSACYLTASCSVEGLFGFDTIGACYTNTIVLAVLGCVASLITIEVCSMISKALGTSLALVCIVLFLALTFTEFVNVIGAAVSDSLTCGVSLSIIGLHYSHVALLTVLVMIATGLATRLDILYSHLVEVLWLLISAVLYSGVAISSRMTTLSAEDHD